MPLYKNPDFRRLPPGLEEIFHASGQQSFFGLPQWYDLMARFGVPRDSEIRVYTDEQPGSRVALPLLASRRRGRQSLTSLTSFYSVEHGPIAAPDADLDHGVAAILSQIAAERPRWDCLSLSELDPREPGCATLARRLRRAGHIVECAAGAATWYEATGDVKFADYLAARPSQLRNTWRRKRRAVSAGHRLDRAFISGPAGIAGAIAGYETVYAASWKQPEPFPEFMPALIRTAAGLGALRLGLYYIDGVPAAAQFWIVWQGRAVIYKLAHDRRFDALSLGTMLTMEMIERVLEEDRPAEINFGRGDDPYKRLWLPRRRERCNILAANPRTIGGLRLGLERTAARIYHSVGGLCS